MLAGAQQEAAAGGKVEGMGIAADLGEHRRQAATAQPFLERPQNVGSLLHPHDDKTICGDAETGETGGVGEARFIAAGGF